MRNSPSAAAPAGPWGSSGPISLPSSSASSSSSTSSPAPSDAFAVSYRLASEAFSGFSTDKAFNSSALTIAAAAFPPPAATSASSLSLSPPPPTGSAHMAASSSATSVPAVSDLSLIAPSTPSAFVPADSTSTLVSASAPLASSSTVPSSSSPSSSPSTTVPLVVSSPSSASFPPLSVPFPRTMTPSATLSPSPSAATFPPAGRYSAAAAAGATSATAVSPTADSAYVSASASLSSPASAAVPLASFHVHGAPVHSLDSSFTPNVLPKAPHPSSSSSPPSSIPPTRFSAASTAPASTTQAEPTDTDTDTDAAGDASDTETEQRDVVRVILPPALLHETAAKVEKLRPHIAPSTDAPAWSRYPFISRGYRLNYTAKHCTLSLCAMHNETCNVWTHVLGFFFFLCLGVYRWNTVLYQASPLNQVAFVGSYIGLCVCMLCSAVFHLYGCMSEEWQAKLYQLDMTGICVAVAGQYAPGYTIGFTCYPELLPFYFAATYTMVILCIIFQNHPACLAPRWFAIRLSTTISSIIFALVPTFHISLITTEEQRNIFVPAILKTMATFAAGFLVWMSKFPERYFPNTFMAFSSHCIWHMFVVLAPWIWDSNLAIMIDMVNRGAWTCPNLPLVTQAS